jgi:hypothetical protein
VAGANGSRGASGRSIETEGKSRWIPAAFSFLLAVPMTGEYPAGLLDIEGSLC